MSTTTTAARVTGTPCTTSTTGDLNIHMFDSSVIKLAVYDPELEAMLVMFTSGKCYLYTDVEQNTYIELLEAESAGKYFNENIRNSYDYCKLAA